MIKRAKQSVKNILTTLPFTAGEQLLHAYAALKFWVRTFRQRGKYEAERLESDRILAVIREVGLRKAVVIYDCHSSPPTYGDFICVVMLARYFLSQSIRVDFVVLDDKHREDWAALDLEQSRQRVNDFLDIARSLLDSKLAPVKVETISWQELQPVLDHADIEKAVIPFEDRILSRTQIYGSCFNVLNYLCADISRKHLDRFLLSFDELASHLPQVGPHTPYVSVHCRHSALWASERDTADEEFLKIYRRLQALFPAAAIMIISDQAGCNHFKTVASKYRLTCLFSKDYSNSFLGDAALILGSKFHFTLRGGGIDVIAMFSSNDYEFFATYANERAWNGVQANAWSTDRQRFNNIFGSHRLFLPTGHIPLNAGCNTVSIQHHDE